jgi:hypothetical protein
VVPKGAHPAREAVAEAQAAHDHNQAQMVMTAVVTSEKYGGGGDDCCADPCGLGSEGNPANNEMNYAYQLAAAASATIDGFQPYIVIDTVNQGRLSWMFGCSVGCLFVVRCFFFCLFFLCVLLFTFFFSSSLSFIHS